MNNPTLGHCKDCKFWEYHRDMWNREYHTCDVDWIDEINAPIKNNERAIFADANDDQGLTAVLITGPLFGCIQFKPK